MDQGQVIEKTMRKRQLHCLPRFLFLLAVLVWPVQVALGQQQHKTRPAHSSKRAISYVFVSPNTSENLTLPQAIAALNSWEEKRLLGEVRFVACRLHLEPRVQKAIGSWTDGAEHSTMLRVTASEAEVRYASSWLGKFARQKAALYFRRGALGGARLFVLVLPRNGIRFGAVANQLDVDGVENRTMVRQRKGIVIYIVDLKNDLNAKVLTVAHKLHARLSSLRGDGEFIGDDNDREKARAVFEQEIVKYEAGHPRLGRACRRTAATAKN